MSKPDAIKAFGMLKNLKGLFAITLAENPKDVTKPKPPWIVTMGYEIKNRGEFSCYEETFTTLNQVTRFLEGK